MQRGYHRRHITGGQPKKLSKADQALWDEWVILFKSGKTKRPFKFWKKDKKNEGDTMNNLIEKYLGEAAEYALYWKTPKEKKFKRVVEFPSKPDDAIGVARMMNQYKTQIMSDNQIPSGQIQMIMVKQSNGEVTDIDINKKSDLEKIKKDILKDRFNIAKDFKVI